MRGPRTWLLGLAAQALAAKFEPGSPCLEPAVAGTRAMVTGVSGMLGSHVAEALLARGYEVHGVVRPRSNLVKIASFKSRIKVVIAELTDPFRTLQVIREARPQVIFHYAAQAFNALSNNDPDYTLITNVRSTLNILESVRILELQNETRLFVVGSSTSYGLTAEQWDGPVPESAPFQPVSPYGVSKATTELLAFMYARAHGMRVVVGRFFLHIAPRGVEALALHEFARQIASIELGLQDPVILHGDIDTIRDVTDVVDSAPVMVCLAEVAPSGTVVNIGSNVSWSMRELLDQAVAMSTVPGIRLQLDPSRLRPYDERSVRADITRVRELTGWIPQPDAANLIQLVLDYWRREISFGDRARREEQSRQRAEL